MSEPKTGASTPRLAAQFKQLFESLAPDLRRHMRPGATGKVVKVNEDKFTVDVEVSDAPPEGEEAGPAWVLPDVPVSSVAAGDGYGVFALPEEGAEVTVSFKNFDVTQPRVDGAEFLQNRTPIGGRAGSITLVDRSGQRFTLRPDTGEVIFRAYNIDDQCAGARTETTLGKKTEDVRGAYKQSIGGSAEKVIERNLTETVAGRLTRRIGSETYPVFEEYTDWPDAANENKVYQHAQLVHGRQRVKVDGGQDINVGGDRATMVLGSDSQTISGNKTIAALGRLQIIAAGAKSDGSVPSPTELINVEVGGPGICCWGGPFLGPIAPMVNGLALTTAVTVYTTTVAAAVATLGGSFSGPDPVVGSKLAGALGIFATALQGANTTLGLALTAANSLRNYIAWP